MRNDGVIVAELCYLIRKIRIIIDPFRLICYCIYRYM